jgi:hypothetical protein
MSYLLVGDIHSQGPGLAQAIKYARENELRPIFLGDVFDSRCDNSNTIYVWNQLRVAQKELGAVVLNSNHQVRLRNFLDADFESPSYTSETWRTLAEFQEAGVDMEELRDWLGQRPDGVSFLDKDGRFHGCSHAYFPLSWVDHKQTDGIRVYYCKDRNEEEQVVWGPHRHGHRRLRWWEDETPRSWTRCAGHYHTVYKSENNVVLDANSGYPDGRVPAYVVDIKELVYFN